MSKLSFRARQVDANRRMPIFLSEDIPDLSEHASTNRTMHQMPTGMEKEEEMELHLQQAISARQRLTVSRTDEAGDDAVIPIPKVSTDVDHYDRFYPPDYKLPKQLIMVQAALSLNPEKPDYDLDSEDESWLRSNEASPTQFERIIEVLEAQSELKVVKASEASALLPQEDEDVVLMVYDYWLAKRCAAQGRPLIPRVKTDKRDNQASNANNPYVAFRRRAEKMQTRKNRRNDEESYEKILKLRSDLQRATMLAEMVKNREEQKRQLIGVNFDIIEKQFGLQEFQADIFAPTSGLARASFDCYVDTDKAGPFAESSKVLVTKKRRQRQEIRVPGRVRFQSSQDNLQTCTPSEAAPIAMVAPTSVAEATIGNGRYAFVRKRGCHYFAPVEDGHQVTEESPFRPARLHSRRSDGMVFAGLVRRRFGRGGRILLDRARLRRWEADSSEVPSQSPEWVDKSATYEPVWLEDELESEEADADDGATVTLIGPNGKFTLPAIIGAVDAEGDEQSMSESSVVPNKAAMDVARVVEPSAETILSASQSELSCAKGSSPERPWEEVMLDDSASTIEVDLDSSDDLSSNQQSASMQSVLRVNTTPTPSPPAPPPYHHQHTVTTPLLRPGHLSLNQLNSSNPMMRKVEDAARPGVNLVLTHIQAPGGRSVAGPGQAVVLPPGVVRIGPKALRGRGRSLLRLDVSKSPRGKVMGIGAQVGAPALAASPVPTPASDHGYLAQDQVPLSQRFSRVMAQTSLSQQYKSRLEKNAGSVLKQLGYPLPTPSPSPGAMDIGGDSATKWDDYVSKAPPISAHVFLTRPPLGETFGSGIN